jgi:hypothetical protein
MTEASGSNAGNFLLGRIPLGTKPKAFFLGYVLAANDAAQLLDCCRHDGRIYVYNAVASFLSALWGLQTQQAAWAVTKLYYSVFYIGRAALSRSGHVTFHALKDGGIGYTQYEMSVRAGERAIIVDKIPSTHKLVAQRFAQYGYPPFMRGLTIDGQDPIAWIMDQREYWQYRCGRFPDPELPLALENVEPEKIQRLLTAYSTDKSGIFLADPAHAIVAVPFRLVEWALGVEKLATPGVIDDGDIAYLRKHCSVGKQKLNPIERLL